MRIDNHEFIALQHIAAFHNLSQKGYAFTLPSINEAIPLSTVESEDEIKMAKLLIDAGVIDVLIIPDSASTAHQIIKHGIESWFRNHVSSLHVIDVAAEILPPPTVKEIIEECDECNDEPEHRDFNGGFGIALRGFGSFNPHLFGTKALSIELTHPGLFKAAMLAIEQAAEITLPIRLPTDVYEMHQYLWEEWGQLKGPDSVPKDEEVREALVWNFGDDGEDAERYLPSNIITMLGGDLAIPALCKKQDRMLKREIIRISRSSKDGYAQAVAKSLLKLTTTIAVAKKKHAYLPNMGDLTGQTIEPGCTLLYKYDDAIYQTINSRYQDSMQGGYATDMIGMSEIPCEVQAISGFFTKLGVALKVLSALDELLSVVTEPYIET